MSLSEVKQEYSWLRRLTLQFISEKDYDKIEKTSVKLSFKKGETILKQGSQPTHIVYLEKGIVKFNFEDEDHKNLILTIVSAPKILGGANLFYKDNNLFSIIALSDCELTLMDAHVLKDILMDNSRFAMMMFQVASEMFKKSIINFISLAHKQKEGRIADVFLFLSSEVFHCPNFHLCLTRKEVAEFAGCSTENVIMTLSKWQNEGIVSIEGKNMSILKMDQLKYISKVG